MTDDLVIYEIHETDPGVEHVLQRHHTQMRSQSPEESCHVMTGDELRASGARLFAAREGQTVLGIGALKPIGADQIELKSMHTVAEARGKGVGRSILDHLVATAIDMGACEIVLETGSDANFLPARTLYAQTGFSEIPPFGDYQEDPLSTFMCKTLRSSVEG